MSTKAGNVANNAWVAFLEYQLDDYDETQYMIDCDFYAKCVALNDVINLGTLKKTLAVTTQTSITRTTKGNSYVIESEPINKTFWINKTHSSQSITITGKAELTNGVLWQGSSSSTISGTSTVTQTITVPAKTSYNVTYNANGGSGAPSTQTKWYGESLTLSSTKPTRSGWTFVGWAKSASATSAAYAAGASYTGNAALALYAVWKKTITVSYNANNGTGVPSSQSVTIYNAASSGSITLTTTKPTRDGFKFAGWATSASATAAAYQAGTAYSFSANTTLYAVWSATLFITSLTAERCDSSGTQDDTGTYAKVTCMWSIDSSATGVIAGTYCENGTSSSIPFSFTSGASGSGSVTSTAIVGGGALSTDKQYIVEVSLSATSGGATQTASRSCILTKAKFTMDWKAGGEGIGIFVAAPASGLEVGDKATFDDDVTLAQSKLILAGPLNQAWIEAHDQNTANTGMNVALHAGGNLILGAGESASNLLEMLEAGTLDDIGAGGEHVFLTSDGGASIYANCNSVANRMRASLQTDGTFNMPSSVRLVDSDTYPTAFPNARARSAKGYFYGAHVGLRSREYGMDNGASSRTAQVTNVPLDVTDENNATFMRITARQTTAGYVEGGIEAVGTHTGSSVWNAIWVIVRPDGSQHYAVGNPANFRDDLGINNASNLNEGTLAVARLPTVTVAKGGTGATSAAAARANLGAAAATWTQVATTTGTTAKTFTALNEAGYHEVLILAYHSTDYWGTCLLRVADLTTSDREVYLTGGNISASSGRRACCKMQVGKITPINIWIDGTNYSGTWRVYAR